MKSISSGWMETRAEIRTREQLSPLPPKPLEIHDIADTRFGFPRRNFPIVSRRALLDQLDAGLNYRLILLSAPAGSGKTTLVGEWLEERCGRLSPFAWVSLEQGDNEPVRFWRTILTACQVFGPTLGERGLQQLRAWQNPHFETILGGWIQELGGINAEAILCLDDYHEIDSLQIAESVRFLIDHLPRQLHLVILTRDPRGLALGRLKAHHEVCELLAPDLRFSQAETGAFFELNLPFKLSAEELSGLAERTEGWAAGLRMAALALAQRPDPTHRQKWISSLSGEQRIFQNYLFEDVVQAQPEVVQDFLLKTSLLERLTGPLCSAVTGRSDSVDFLSRLESANLFLTSIQGGADWFRYHSLFSEALRAGARRRFGAEGISELYLKASRWFESQALWVEAVETSFQAESYERAAGLIERMIARRLAQNEHPLLRRLIDRLPGAVLADHPSLCFSLAMAIFFTSDQRSLETIDLLEPALEMAEETWRASGGLAQLGEALAFHAIVRWRAGQFQLSCATAQSALDLLPPEEQQWRSVCLTVLGTEALLKGELSAAWKTLTHSQGLSQSVRNPHGVLQTLHLLGEAALERGDLDGARQLFTQTLEQAEQFAHIPLFQQGYAWLGLAGVSFERDDLAAAGQQAGRALENARQTGDGFTQSKALLMLARIGLAQGDLARAKELLQATLAAARQVGGSLLAPEILAFGARLCLSGGDDLGAERWIEDWKDQSPFGSAHCGGEALALARLNLARGQYSAVLNRSDQAAEAPGTAEKIRSLVEYQLLNALALAALGQVRPAEEAVLAVLNLAQPGGLLRVFLDEGGPLFAVLRESRQAVVAQAPAPILAFYSLLMDAFARQNQSERPQAAADLAPVDPLSTQEERVLALLIKGYSYQEIAGEMVLSINTVKTHVKGVYRKLNVTRRRELRGMAGANFHYNKL